MEVPSNSSEIDEIRQSFETARAAWPGVEFAFEVFSARLAAVGPANVIDLYLACACSEAIPAALAEIARLRERYMPEIHAALRRVIAALDAKERRLLHFYYIDGLTLAKIAALERVGTSTAFRRMNAATQAVLAGMKEELSTRLQISMQSLDSLIRHVQDDIDLSLSQVLGSAA